jgi:hypothetical protein
MTVPEVHDETRAPSIPRPRTPERSPAPVSPQAETAPALPTGRVTAKAQAPRRWCSRVSASSRRASPSASLRRSRT